MQLEDNFGCRRRKIAARAEPTATAASAGPAGAAATAASGGRRSNRRGKQRRTQFCAAGTEAYGRIIFARKREPGSRLGLKKEFLKKWD